MDRLRSKREQWGQTGPTPIFVNGLDWTMQMSRTAAFLRRQAAIRRQQAKENEEERLNNAIPKKNRQSCLFDPPTPNTSGKE